jgi:hypothetical protein
MARRLGRAQGAVIATGLPSHEWLSRAWLRAYLAQRTSTTDRLDDHHVAASLTSLIGERDVGRARSTRAGNASFLDTLDRLPRTLCHLDLHPANLFDCGTSTVVIDWAFVGIGALGEDPGNLVPDAAFDFHVSPASLGDLYEIVASGYEAGLRDAGWEGRSSDVKLGMSATIAAKYVWIAPAIGAAVAEGRELLNRRPIDETLRSWVPTVQFVLDRADEALALRSDAG